MWVASTQRLQYLNKLTYLLSYLKIMLDKIRKTGMDFVDSAWSTKTWASWRWDPRDSTKGELEGELVLFLVHANLSSFL